MGKPNLNPKTLLIFLLSFTVIRDQVGQFWKVLNLTDISQNFYPYLFSLIKLVANLCNTRESS